MDCSVYRFTSLQRPASYVIQDNHRFRPNDFITCFLCVINLNEPPNSQKAGNIFHVESSFQHRCHPPNVTAPTCQCPALEHFCTAVCQGALHRGIATSSNNEMLSSVFVCVLCCATLTHRELSGRDLTPLLVKTFSNFTLSKTIKN